MTKRIISLLVLILILATGCRTKKAQSEAPETAITVLTGSVSKISSSDEISLSGNIEGSKTVRLGFMVAGKINFIALYEGQTVSKGQMISSLDPGSYIIAREMADIQVNQVQDEYNRLKAMYDNKSLSESDFSKITYGLQLAKAQQKLHTRNLADTKLYSPIEGVMLKKLAEVGEITGVGLPLFVISDIRKIKVSAFIPESELHKIKTGQKAEVQISSLSDKYNGKITEVGSAADAASRAFSVKIEIDNPQLVIRPGMIAEVKIIPEKINEVLAIPVGSVLHDYNNQSFVFVVDTAKNKVSRRNVIPGKLINDKIEIISGLIEKEIIVTGGNQKLAEGSLITTSK
ncbi:MAG: efflux RND transporter periplasmic adaptor subunit [Bacteroidia bacterium]|nr:efflux RND transporter periplasmic adaptor subunit [Bacteroidia bacterium]